jgi:3-keto-disaccharide hydrolase
MKSQFRTRVGYLTLTVFAAILVTGMIAQVHEYKSGIVWPEPEIVTPAPIDHPFAPPSDAIVLFDGTDMSAWQGGERWEVKDGYAVSKGITAVSKQDFGDIQLHLEWATPEKVSGEGQGRGNSGVYLMGLYEVQILDSYENTTYYDGQAGSIYKQTPPLVNACRKPGEWQTYDILWEAPHFAADGSLAKPAHVTVLQNGIAVQNHFELLGGTFYDQAPIYTPHAEKGPIHLQFHGNPIRFRNIWVRELKPMVGQKPDAKTSKATKS